MREESESTNSAASELSPSELLLRVSQLVEAVFDDTTERPDLYSDVSTVMSETGIEVRSLSAPRSGAGLKRSRQLKTGTIAYELSEIYYQDLNKGARVYCWSTLGSNVSFSVYSEMYGENKPVLKTDKADMVTLQKMIEGYFPRPKSEPTRRTLAQRALAFLRE
jgi:hypothetical protein